MIIQFQPPCHVQGHQQLDQAAQSHIQPGMEARSEAEVFQLSTVVSHRHLI